MEASTSAPVAVLRGKRFAGGWILYVGGVLFVAGLTNGFWWLTERPSDPVAALLGVGLGAFMLALCLGLALQVVEILPNGISWKRYGREHFLPFASIRKAAIKRCVGNMERYDEVSLTMADGTTYVISHLDKADDLVRYVNTYGARHE